MALFRFLLPVLASVLGFLATGCGPTCQSTCNRLYSNGDDYGLADCAIDRPGVSADSLITTCMKNCNDALATTGEVGDYNPDERHGSSSSIELENELQAAMWMDCVAETSCGDPNETDPGAFDLRHGACAPVW